MRRLTLAFAFIAIASPAFAVNKVAVILDAGGGTAARGIAHQICFDFLNRTGTPYDVFYSANRTWGAPATRDSIWFRQNYAAVIIPYLDGSSGTIAPSWGAKFQNESAQVGVQRSPLSGLWGIPVFVMVLNNNAAMSGGFDESIDNWIGGFRASAGVTNRPGIANRGTWGYKVLCRIRGSQNDTLYTDASKLVCIYPSWTGAGGHGSVAMLVWADTTNSTGWGCTAADSMGSVWRFRPASGGPGITYSVIPVSANSTIDGLLAEFQMLYAQTESKPVRRLQLPIMIHNDYAGTLNAATKAHVQAIHDTLLSNGIPWSMQLPQTDPVAGEYTQHDAETKAEMRRVLSDIRANVTWAPGGNDPTNWTWNHYTAAETTEVRRFFNASMNTAAQADSFGLPKSKMSIRRLVTGSGLVGYPQLKVLADAGVRIVESTATSANGLYAIVSPQTVGGAHPFVVPYPNDNRIVYASGTVGLTDGTTFSAVRGSVTENDWVGSNVTQRICWAIQNNNSLYWHMNGISNGTDGYFKWFTSVIVRQLKYYDKVIEPVSNDKTTVSP